MGPAIAGPVGSFLASYGNVALILLVFASALGAPLPITGLLLSLGALSATPHGPDLVLVAALALGGTVAGDVVVYSAGWVGGAPLLRWVKRVPDSRRARMLEKAEVALLRYGPLILFLSRFLFTVIATPMTLLVGATRLRKRKFLGWDTAGKAVYVGGNLFLGRVFGASLGAHTSGAVLWGGIVAFGLLTPLIGALVARLVRTQFVRTWLLRIRLLRTWLVPAEEEVG